MHIILLQYIFYVCDVSHVRFIKVKEIVNHSYISSYLEIHKLNFMYVICWEWRDVQCLRAQPNYGYAHGFCWTDSGSSFLVTLSNCSSSSKFLLTSLGTHRMVAIDLSTDN